MILAWLILAGTLLSSLFVVIGALSAGGDDQFRAIGAGMAVLMVIGWLIGATFIFLSLRAFVEYLQLKMDVEDNTRATEQALVAMNEGQLDVEVE